jgi:hypothetical protein
LLNCQHPSFAKQQLHASTAGSHITTWSRTHLQVGEIN